MNAYGMPYKPIRITVTNNKNFKFIPPPPLTSNEKLDIALEHLKKYNAGSYLYYQIDFHINQLPAHTDRLFVELGANNVPETEYMPIVWKLIDDKYVDGFWPIAGMRDNRLDPSQLKITFTGIQFIEDGGYVGRNDKEKREKESTKLNNSIIKWFTGLATFGTVGVFVWQIAVYESPSKTESLERLNNIIKIEKEQLEELYRQSVYNEARSYQYEKELSKLRDSIRKK